MKAEIEVIAIGNELLKGFITNTNAAEISQALFAQGFQTCRHTVLPDDPGLLLIGLKESLKRSPLVIATGGLGPTCDDITRHIAADLFDSSFHLDERLADDLKKRYGNLSISLENQATVPSKAKILNNPIGTAAGLIFSSESNTLILMPGVPIEMREMLHNEVIPYLKTHFPSFRKDITASRHFFNLSESAVNPTLVSLQKIFPEVHFGIYPSHGILSIYASIDHTVTTQNLSESPEARINHVLDIVSDKFSKHYFTSPSGKLEEAIHNLFIENSWTLSTAESCTGGGIASRLTKLPNASKYFLGSIVSYSNNLKEDLLKVPHTTIENYGAVSEQTAIAMASGALTASKSTFSVAVTGIAGPSGGSPQKPVGTVWIAVMGAGKQPSTQKFFIPGNRHIIIERSIYAALGTLYSYCLP